MNTLSKVCAYNPAWHSDSCQGDSGSGLVVNTERGPVLVGLVRLAHTFITVHM